MRRIAGLLALILILQLAPTASATYSDLPRTFGGCVAAGGDVRRIDGEVTCRLVRSYDFRIYATGTTECGEEIELEVWGETRTGVVTYLLAPGMTVELPEIGAETIELPGEPLPCLDH